MAALWTRLPLFVTSLFTAIGVWIVIAPTAVSYQPRGAAWTQATYNDITVGAVLVLVGLGLLTAQITVVIRARLAAARH